ncbi:hypothetical protein BCR37DRAFT_383050 [Protomyces lactucae-debilis]|uniref:ML-like domain-containing protein n=1 Tax=Protomyces lactucae-debilis TaxID=2754530 RepID=A0A1Y2F0M4_PROLT|nr:uncharacterized protein BCR37DRAFT_383050 [Protomyces lactucae-debilis]ORY77044.1 hypothetical protein BCR37DRAFT_383050 [Protomyces lactucae-debilis]
MRIATRLLSQALLFLFCLTSSTFALGPERQLSTSALQTCMDNSGLSATEFNVVFTPNNNTLSFSITAKSIISGNVVVYLEVYAYGLRVVQRTIDPCESDIDQLCPVEAGNINPSGNVKVGSDVIGQIPGIAFTVPDVDAWVKVVINDTATGKQVACLRADITNGRSVDVEAVAWVTAGIAAIALLVSIIVSGLSHPNAAAHVATNAVALLLYFQGQAIVGTLAVTYPPIVRSWTQNFAWSLGIINVGWMQDIFTWYIKSSGGSPSTFLNSGKLLTIVLSKRDVIMDSLMSRDVGSSLAKRAVAKDPSANVDVLSGIDRLAYVAGIEDTNLFITGISWYMILIGVAVLALLLFKGIITLLTRKGKLSQDKFIEFRQGWKIVLKGMIFRLVLVSYPAVTLLCVWELTVRHSAGCVVLAIAILVVMSGLLGYAAFRVVRLARRSLELHKNAAYILFSDPKQLSRWGFLYVQFRAAVYWFVIPLLAYLLLKGIIAGAGQGSQYFQAGALLAIEVIYFLMVVIIKPFMDKRTNIFNYAIVSVNALNAIIILFLTDVFKLKGIVRGAMGVIFFVLNAIFATILLIMIICSCCYALFAKNPDIRYQRMKDERNSYLKSKINLDSTTELDHIPSESSRSGSAGRKEMFSESDIVDEYSKEMSSHTTFAGSSSSLVKPGMLNTSFMPASPSGEHEALFAPTRGVADHDNASYHSNHSGQNLAYARYNPASPVVRTHSPGIVGQGYYGSPVSADGRRSPAVQNFSTRSPSGAGQPFVRAAMPTHQSAGLAALQQGGGSGGLREPSLPFAAPTARRGSASNNDEDRWRVGVGYH